jgi:peptide/nickel transport system ATP-binding protein
MDNEFLKIKNVCKYFKIEKDRYVKALDGIDLTINKEETVGLVGESGSGKSTLAYTIMGMYEPTSGSITFQGKDIGMAAKKRKRSLKKNLQIVFQDPSSSLNPRVSIANILSRPLILHNMVPRKNLQEALVRLLKTVELPLEYLYKFTPSIGGGEKQLIAIARAIATNPEFLILDEPTSSLDVSVQGKIINTLVKLKQEMKLTYMFITHDLSLMRNVADKVAILYLGKIMEYAPTKEFFESPLHPYTKMLLSSIPVISKAEELILPDNIHSQGEIPSPVDLPLGCRFFSRCPYAKETCNEKEPDLIEVKKNHFVRCTKI